MYSEDVLEQCTQGLKTAVARSRMKFVKLLKWLSFRIWIVISLFDRIIYPSTIVLDQVIAAFKMFHRNMFSEVDFMLDDLFAQRALIILRLSVHSVLMDFQSAFSGIRGPTDGAEVALSILV